ncbi:MAG: DUF3784 domain-containing protein [Clostridia bacterium]|nr:DUF3784 domain-containing protein [Clostridia bacterium]
MSFWDYLWIFGAFAIAAFFGVVSARHFGEKGYLFNNAYIWASKDEREKMDKKPYYRQSAVIFAILCAAFACMGLYMIFRDAWCLACELVCLAAAGVYAVASEISINKKKKQ